MKVSIAARNTQLNALADSAESGLLQICAGYPRNSPEGPGPAEGFALVTLRLGSPAFGKAIDGKIILAPIVGERVVENGGKPTWFRIWRKDGVTVIADGTVGKKNADMILPVADLPAGAEVEIESLTIELPMEPQA